MTDVTYAWRVTMLEAEVLDALTRFAGPVVVTGAPGSGYSVPAGLVGQKEWLIGVPLPPAGGLTVVMRQHRLTPQDKQNLHIVGYHDPDIGELHNGQALIITAA